MFSYPLCKQGFYFKRLEKGSFRWPQEGDEPTMAFDPEELMVLLGGVRVELKLKRKEVIERRFNPQLKFSTGI